MKLQINVKRRLAYRCLSMPRYERGAATILTVLLIGVGLVSASLGAMHSVRSTQERQLAAHAQVNAQSGVWSTVEVVRAYLQTLNKDQLTTLAENQVWTITGNDNLAQQAILVDITPPIAPALEYKVSARLTATDIAARSSSSLEVVYEVTPAMGASSVMLNGVLDFYNDLKLSGDVKMKVPGGGNINVDGDFTAGGSVTGIDGYGLGTVAVTGSVVVGSDIKAEVLRGKNITINGGATAKKIYAFGDPDVSGDDCCGNVTMTGGTGAQVIQANGSVTLAGGDVSLTVDALRDITVDRGGSAHGVLTAGRDIFVKQGNSILATRSIRNTTISSNTDIPSIAANNNVSCAAGLNWKRFPSITAGGVITSCTPGATFQPNTMPNPAIQLIPKVPPVVMIQPVVDAWAVKASANYIFEYIDNTMTVTVKNVNGIPNDEYYLGTYSDTGAREYLCKAINPSTKQCTAPATSSEAKTICNAFSSTSPCFAYDPVKEQWKIAGKNMAPGAVWFKGNVDIGTGEYYNTFIASGNITSSGSLKVYALNQAGYDVVCNNDFKLNKVNDFFGLYPTNFCNTGAQKLIPNSLGNIALLAGGYNPDDNTGSVKTVYTGGNVNLAAGNYIHGTVLAGNLLGTEGATVIYGYVSAAGLQKLESAENSMGASTTIDLTGLPASFNPGEVPDMGAVTAEPSSVVLWSRYL